MRVAFVGAGEETVRTAEILVDRGHEVIIIETQEDIIDELSEQLDCSFLHGDGSNPAILREVSPEKTDILFCLSSSDQTNIIASLVGRSLGFHRVITRLENPEFESICYELGLKDTIIPSKTIARYLGDMVEGSDILELSTIVKGDARFLTFTAGEKDAGSVSDLDLPEDARVICYYRDEDFYLVDGDTNIQESDQVVVLTTSANLPALEERWNPQMEEGDSNQDR